jgi:hypothetical protein
MKMTKVAAARRWSKRVDRIHAEYQRRVQAYMSAPKLLNDDKPVSIFK